MSDDDSAPEAPRRTKPWIPHRPEQRFSIVVDQFLNAALVPPFYASAHHDADEGGRTDRQRARDKLRGIKPGQLDWEVVQPGIWRKVELKRGKNVLSDNQKVTIRKLSQCGFEPVVAYGLRVMARQMLIHGFKFHDNLETLLQKYEAQLDALDRTAELTLAGTIVKKPARASKPAPRFVAGKKMSRRMNLKGMG